MTLLEFLVAIWIIIVLIAGVGFQLRGLIQRAKVIAAKSTIGGFALSLAMIKADASLYPEELEHVNLATAPETGGPADFSENDWLGPYAITLSLKDPWGNDYFYWLTESTIFGPETIGRTAGKPYETTFSFPATAGVATLIVDNQPGVTSGSVTLNDVEIVSEYEFQNIIPVIIKWVVLQETNTMVIQLASTPGLSITLRITASATSPDAIFVLGSKGRDGKFGGTKFDADIVYGYFR